MYTVDGSISTAAVPGSVSESDNYDILVEEKSSTVYANPSISVVTNGGIDEYLTMPPPNIGHHNIRKPHGKVSCIEQSPADPPPPIPALPNNTGRKEYTLSTIVGTLSEGKLVRFDEGNGQLRMDESCEVMV